MARFNWKIEEHILVDTKIAHNREDGTIYYTYPIEDVLSTQEKRDWIAKATVGKSEYFIELNNKYLNDYIENYLPSVNMNTPMCIRESNTLKYIKEWVRTNDVKHLFTIDDETIWSSGCIIPIDILGVKWKFATPKYIPSDFDFECMIINTFHKICCNLEKKELAYINLKKINERD